MTQFINKSLPAPDAYPVRIFINISYTFLPCPRRHCDSDFELEISHTDSEQDSFSKHGIEPDHRLRDTTSNGTKQFFIDFDERMDGFFLALKSKMKGVCVNVSRVFVYRHECPGHDRHNIGLVRRPSTQAPIEGNVSVKSQCAENSNFTDMSMPDLLVCTSNGKWLNDQTQCVCNEGYEQIDNNFNCESKHIVKLRNFFVVTFYASPREEVNSAYLSYCNRDVYTLYLTSSLHCKTGDSHSEHYSFKDTTITF